MAIAQQRGAEKQKKKQEEKDRKEATRIKRMSQLPHNNRKVQNKVVSRSGSFKVAPSPSKTVPAAPSSMTSTSPFKVSYHRQNTEGTNLRMYCVIDRNEITIFNIGAKKQLFHSKNTAVGNSLRTMESQKHLKSLNCSISRFRPNFKCGGVDFGRNSSFGCHG